MYSSLEQSAKVLGLMVFTFSGMVMDSSSEQFAKAYSPMEVRFLGRVTVFREVLPRKAKLPMV